MDKDADKNSGDNERKDDGEDDNNKEGDGGDHTKDKEGDTPTSKVEPLDDNEATTIPDIQGTRSDCEGCEDQLTTEERCKAFGTDTGAEEEEENDLELPPLRRIRLRPPELQGRPRMTIPGCLKVTTYYHTRWQRTRKMTGTRLTGDNEYIEFFFNAVECKNERPCQEAIAVGRTSMGSPTKM